MAVTTGCAAALAGEGPQNLGCDGYHTGVWGLSQPDVTLQADTNFVQV